MKGGVSRVYYIKVIISISQQIYCMCVSQLKLKNKLQCGVQQQIFGLPSINFELQSGKKR